MTYDNLFADRATFGRSYACLIQFQDSTGKAIDMTPITGLQMDFKASYSDTGVLFSLTPGNGLMWFNDDATTGALQINITTAQMGMVTFTDPNPPGQLVPSTSLFGDLKVTAPDGFAMIYDEGTVPKLYLTVEQKITA